MIDATQPVQVQDPPRHGDGRRPGLRRLGDDRRGADARRRHPARTSACSIWDVSNGSRLETYALEGEPGSGVVCVNGAAAHHVRPGDVVIIATFAEAESEAEARAWKPTVVRVDAANRLVAGPRVRDTRSGPPAGLPIA